MKGRRKLLRPSAQNPGHEAPESSSAGGFASPSRPNYPPAPGRRLDTTRLRCTDFSEYTVHIHRGTAGRAACRSTSGPGGHRHNRNIRVIPSPQRRAFVSIAILVAKHQWYHKAAIANTQVVPRRPGTSWVPTCRQSMVAASAAPVPQAVPV